MSDLNTDPGGDRNQRERQAAAAAEAEDDESEVETETAPGVGAGADDGGHDTKTAEDFFVTRDEEGELNTLWMPAGPYGEVEVRPMVYGTAERLFGEQGNAAMVGPETVAEILREHIVTPDLEAHAESEYGVDEGEPYALNARVISEEMEPFAPVHLLQAVFTASGFDPSIDMDAGGNAAIDFDGMEAGN